MASAGNVAHAARPSALSRKQEIQISTWALSSCKSLQQNSNILKNTGVPTPNKPNQMGMWAESSLQAANFWPLLYRLLKHYLWSIRDYPGRPNVMIKSLQEGCRRSQSQEKEMWWWSQRVEWCALKMEKETMRQECRCPLEAGRGKETDSPLKSPEGKQWCHHLGGDLLTFITVENKFLLF